MISLPGSTISTMSSKLPTSPQPQAQPQSYFAQVAAAPADQWLRPQGARPQGASSLSHPTMNYFAEVARRGNQHWLLESNKVSSNYVHIRVS